MRATLYHTASARRALLSMGVAAILSVAPRYALAQDDGSGADQGAKPNTALSDLALQSEVDRSLSDAAGVAKQALTDMEAAEGAGASASLAPVNISSLPPELQRPITVAWTGPADALVRRVAQGIGYTYSETGTAPVVPDMVVVRYNNEPAAIVLQDLGLRVSKVAQVSVDTTARSITYVNNPPQIAPLVPPTPTPATTPPPAPAKPHHNRHASSPDSLTIYGYPKSLFLDGQ